MFSKRLYLLSMLLFLGLLVLDQWTKVIVEGTFALGETKPLISFFSLTYVRNEGAAWGMFSGAQYVLAGIGVLALVLCTLFWKKIMGSRAIYIPLGAILYSGIVGNLIDRVRLNYVIDFFHFHIGAWSFPCFNIADCCICVSVACIIVLQFYFDFKAKDQEKP